MAATSLDPARPSAPPSLSDGTVTLRPPEPADAEGALRACQDPEIQRWTTVPSPYGPADAAAWVAMGDDPVAWWDNPAWTVTIPGIPGYSGGLDLRPDGAGGCTVGYLLAPWARGHGHAARALRLACVWAFDTLRVEVVRWECYAGNEASRKVAVTAGFHIVEGTLRKALPYRGIRRDAWLGDLVPQDLQRPTVPAHASAARRQGALPTGPALTAREREVLGQLAQGKSNRDLARALGISENTVKNHVRSVLEKLNAQSRSEAVVIALKGGIVTLQR